MPESMQAKEAREILVFSILRNSKCAECGEELGRSSLLTLEDHQPHCLRCADLDHLVYLERGDVCLTRRSRKYSPLSAVVLRFSRSRGRYERQGILVEEAALKRAEEECLEDEDLRAAQRERAEVRRVGEDKKLTEEIAREIRRLFPGAPAKEVREIAEHASVRGSGRVGRTAAAKSLDEGALTAAVIAAIRHRHTRYDELLMEGEDRMIARSRTRDEVEEVLERWRTR
jgi:hypothetical protein